MTKVNKGVALVDRIGLDGKRQRVSGQTNLEKWQKAKKEQENDKS